MSQYLVIDTSFIISSIMPDEKNTDLSLINYNVYVPAIFYLECTNVLTVALKKRRISMSDFEEYQQVISNLPFIVDTFSAMPECVHSLSRLSQQFDLTSYDSSYLELALRLGAKLGSYDQKLLAACNANQITTIG